MCKKGGLERKEPLKLDIMIAKESGKREEKDTCRRISNIKTFYQSHEAAPRHDF